MAGSICASAREYRDHLRRLVDELDCDAIDAVAEAIFEAWRADRQVLVFGNGGSAATASHYVTDLVKTAAVEGARPLRALCLADNVPMTTALGNDIDYAETFAYPLAVYAREGDVAIAISCSGTSPNVVAAARAALDRGLTLVALTGFQGGTIADMAHLHVHVASDNYGPIEDLHMSIGHILTQQLKTRVGAHQRDSAARDASTRD